MVILLFIVYLSRNKLPECAVLAWKQLRKKLTFEFYYSLLHFN